MGVLQVPPTKEEPVNTIYSIVQYSDKVKPSDFLPLLSYLFQPFCCTLSFQPGASWFPWDSLFLGIRCWGP